MWGAAVDVSTIATFENTYRVWDWSPEPSTDDGKLYVECRTLEHWESFQDPQ
jgi:hypothetical protein